MIIRIIYRVNHWAHEMRCVKILFFKVIRATLSAAKASAAVTEAARQIITKAGACASIGKVIGVTKVYNDI